MSGDSERDQAAADPSYVLRGSGKLRPLAPTGGVRVAVVATLRDVRDQLLLWAEWYRIAGFAHLFLYFDDPSRDEDSIAEAIEAYSQDFLTIIRNGAELQAEWPSLRCWGQFAPFVDDRMCRQLLNIAHCVRRALLAGPSEPGGADWLIHLDHDELFMPPPQGLQEHFLHLEAGGCRLFLYQNYEAVPEGHTLTPFLDVRLFKVPQGRVPRTPLGAQGLDYWASRTKAGNYFLYYDNGKSAVRLRREGKANAAFAPRSVHLLYPEDEVRELQRDRAAWTNFPEHELHEIDLQWMVSQTEDVAAGAKVLHYPATHFERLFRKYDHLKNFPAVRFGGGLVVPPSFHLEARDCYVASAVDGPEAAKQKLKELLEHAVMLAEPADEQALALTGTIVDIRSIGESLRCGRWIAPASLVESPLARFRRRLPPERLTRLLAFPRHDAELLRWAVPEGGLLRQLEDGLDDVRSRLEASGWAACALGAHAGLLAAAREEAEALRGRLAPGMTVVKNQVVDQRLPNAQRGDKILWMQEQGLSDAALHGAGDEAAKGASRGREAATLAMLESALCDLGMQLDARLQRSSMRLRVTMRCDGMLACYDGGGASYGPHIDNADGDGRVDGRILTAVLYLNPDWDRSNGGELAIFEPSSGELDDPDVSGQWHNVWPDAGTLVFFRADRTLHEVRPCKARRYALSAWFCGQPVGYGGDVA